MSLLRFDVKRPVTIILCFVFLNIDGLGPFNICCVLKREKILEDIWGENDYFLGRSMDVFVTRLRKYLNPDISISLDTIRGVGLILRVN